MTRNGRIVRHLDERRLTTLLRALLKPQREGAGLLNRAVPGRQSSKDDRTEVE